MPNTPLSNPSRPELREAAYRKYESILLEFLDTFPAPFRVKPMGIALSTLVVQLRIAANAVLANSHTFKDPILIDLETLRSVWPKVKVSVRGEEVVIAEPQALLEVTRAQIAEGSAPKPMFTIANPTLADLAAFASLFQRQSATEPFLFTGEVPAFTPPPGVAFEQTPDGWMML